MKRYLLHLILFLATLQGYSQKRTYEYDDLNRLSKVYVYNGTTLTHTITYNYDEMGNRLSKVVVGGANPSTDMMAHYPFNANSNDESGNNHHLINTNAVLTTDRHGVANRAYYFNGTSKLISDDVSYLYNTSFTISYWAKPDTYKALIFIRSGSPSTNGALHIAMRSENIYTFAFYDNDYDFTNFKKDSQWHQYIMIYDKTAAVRRIYEDGVLIGTQACNFALFTQNSPLVLGYSWDTNYPDHYVGKLDDIRVYNRALTNAEATDIYNQEKPINTQTIAINSPTSGTFTAGQSVSVSYASTNGSANVSLELVSCAGTTAIAVIGANTTASGNTDYTLPTSLTVGSYRIKSYVTTAPEQAFYGSCFTVNTSSSDDCPPTISHSGTITANTYQASQTIVSTANVSTNTKYYAGQSVTLSPGFSAGPGENFEVRIQGCATVPTNGLVAYYPFNGNANDESGSGNHGTVNGATLVSDRNGNAEKAYRFNDNQSIRVPNSASLNLPNAFTFSVWVNLQATAGRDGWGNMSTYGYHPLFTKDCDRGRLQAAIAPQSDGSYLLTTWAGSGGNQQVIPFQLNQWRHIALSYNGSTLKQFVNSTLVSTTTVTMDLTATNSADLYIGKMNCWVYFFNGALDEFRIYNRALSDSEVLQIYNAEKP